MQTYQTKNNCAYIGQDQCAVSLLNTRNNMFNSMYLFEKRVESSAQKKVDGRDHDAQNGMTLNFQSEQTVTLLS